MKYIPAYKIIAEIQKRIEETKSMKPSFDQFWAGQISAFKGCLNFIASLQQEQPDNEDIDKVAQELYEHLYELKRRNNVPTNLYDKQEIINLWKAGIEYAYNHPKQEQPSLPSNLDEAAEEYCSDNTPLGATCRACFRDGAEWMAGQGQTIESLVWRDEDDNLFIEAFIDENEFKMADNIIIQIRK